ncbi:MAG TPA: RdgB/HAM1 family non-canonical purine NTP pyrophosphatase [Tepidisphaeraceae bacterium]
MRLLIATTNAGKIKEFREMVGEDIFEWSDLSSQKPVEPVEEIGATFRANACLKASHYALRFNTWTLADDSGLEVDVLAGRPGVHSARWAEINNAGQGDAANNALLLRQLQQFGDNHRQARFVCVLALADPAGRIILTARDTVEGRLLRQPRGHSGFGYDPLFFIDSLSKTTAELPPDQKNAISHRGKALRRMRALIDRMNLGQK